MNLHLQDKVIVVAEGAGAIAEAVTRKLAEEGAIPVIVGRNKDDNEKLVHEIEASGGKAFQVVAGLTEPEALSRAITAIEEKFGHIEGLVNNAGVSDTVAPESGEYEKFMAALHKNLVHYYLMAQLVLPHLKKCKGSIVNISSGAAETSQDNTYTHAALNGGRNALTREWAVELLSHGIRVNSVVAAEYAQPDGSHAGASKALLENRITRADEIADAVVFLLSDRSGHTTGQLIHLT